jgi:heme/copper-type cytochrome/quinol oxidase subunit 2
VRLAPKSATALPRAPRVRIGAGDGDSGMSSAGIAVLVAVIIVIIIIIIIVSCTCVNRARAARHHHRPQLEIVSSRGPASILSEYGSGRGGDSVVLMSQ